MATHFLQDFSKRMTIFHQRLNLQREIDRWDQVRQSTAAAVSVRQGVHQQQWEEGKGQDLLFTVAAQETTHH